MRVLTVDHELVTDAANTLARAMLDEACGRWLLPDDGEFLAFHHEVYAQLMERALTDGRVHAWGPPMVGVALWVVRPSVGDDPALANTSTLARQVDVDPPEGARERIERYGGFIRDLRLRARPDPHAYLDSLAVLPEHRGQGIASRLLEAGHAWADEQGLPCALETESEANVRFYARRGYRVVATVPVPEANLTITSMRREDGTT